MKIALLDYGAGNVASVERALHRLGAESNRAAFPSDLANANRIILPGVGHFAALIRALDERRLREPLMTAIRRGIPFLGICLGLQALYERSEEAPGLAGLAIFAGEVRALPSNVKLPHMGWNRIRVSRRSELLHGLSEQDYFYFAHTFAATESSSEVVATCDHGAQFTVVLQKENIFGVQFHPEKSGAAGARVLRNFLRLAA
ncbi:MAG TPA: imidazole glycerol phosphate synthase subunit HisH [Candidatus Sulfotelmatobacter sp.]|nr:imidazole glycerol phosphate synthase subunit HisH [Candidatus Sulfotelmatobacter sp.]HUI75530.1 imidazole glycerol phosphate synthase subunit HisH [Candidatus Acidoferrum sp.]